MVRSYEPFKTIKEEYLIISWMSLLGNVGGTLGMFIGFLFIPTSEWAIDAGLSVWKRCMLFWVVHCAQLFPSVLFSLVDTHPTGNVYLTSFIKLKSIPKSIFVFENIAYLQMQIVNIFKSHLAQSSSIRDPRLPLH